MGANQEQGELFQVLWHSCESRLCRAVEEDGLRKSTRMNSFETRMWNEKSRPRKSGKTNEQPTGHSK
jgi:hypothetical protein